MYRQTHILWLQDGTFRRKVLTPKNNRTTIFPPVCKNFNDSRILRAVFSITVVLKITYRIIITT